MAKDVIVNTGALTNNGIKIVLCRNSEPGVIPFGARYGSALLVGFTQGVGPTLWGIRIYNAAITTVDLMTGAAPTAASPSLSFETGTNSLVITPANDANPSKYTVIIGNSNVS